MTASRGQRKVKLAVPDWGLAYCADWTAGGKKPTEGEGEGFNASSLFSP